MSINSGEVEQALLSLSSEERAAVIRRGLISLEGESADTTQGEVEATWREELRTRLGDSERGDVALLDVEQSHDTIRSQLAADLR